MKIKGVVDRIEGEYIVVRSDKQNILIPKKLSLHLVEGELLVIDIKKVDNKKVVQKTKKMILGILEKDEENKQ